MAAATDVPSHRLIQALALGTILIAAGWVFPPFHVVRIAAIPAPATTQSTAGFDAKAVAARIWRDQLPAVTAHAPDAATVVAALRQNLVGAIKTYGKTVGVGATYFTLRGRGRVVARDRNELTVALDAAGNNTVALRIGPVLGNTVRDGSGVLDLNSFPGLAEFNALSAELNALVERNVLPGLRQAAKVGSTVTFAGCAEAPDGAPDADSPALTIVPLEAHVE